MTTEIKKIKLNGVIHTHIISTADVGLYKSFNTSNLKMANLRESRPFATVSNVKEKQLDDIKIDSILQDEDYDY